MGQFGFCNECKTELQAGKYKFNRGKKLCLSCYDRVVLGKRKVEKQREDLDNYLCELFGFEEVPIEYTRQIDRFIKEYKFTPKGIKATAYYFYELLGNDIANDRVLGIIPQVYNQARKHFQESAQVSQKNQEFVNKEETIVVKIRKPKGDLPLKSSIEDWE